MKLLQNQAGNFLNMTPRQAKEFAAKLVAAADESIANLTSGQKRGAGFVQTIIIQEDRSPASKHDVLLDTVFVGISPTWLDVHPNQLPELQPREKGIMHIDRNEVNVGHA